MDFYLVLVAVLAAFAASLAYILHKGRASRAAYTTSSKDDSAHVEDLSASAGEDAQLSQAAATFRNNYFAVYTLVLAADWLQGPYVYSIYHEDHKLPERTIAALFGTGFVVAGIASSFLGALADRYGRRLACLGFCAATSLSCLSVMASSSNLYILFLGRALGGLSSTLLYSVFEAWMVTEHNTRDLGETLPLSDMFGASSTLSGVVAIVTGVIAQCMVSYTGSRATPFVLAICLLILAAAAILRYWNENYGQPRPLSGSHKEEEMRDFAAPTEEPSSTAERLRLMILGLTTAVFEGSMYVFVFLWTPALTSSRDASGYGGDLPLGLIFSSFMCAMMIGSMTFTALSARGFAPVRLLVDVLTGAACALLVPVLWHQELVTFGSFIFFEMAVGIYFPVMGKLKSDWVRDSVRAKVYTWMRLPLNLFVFVALGVTKEGDYHRTLTFNVLGGLLFATAVVVRTCLV
ncbi:major facilitator superfamily transporter domain-containing protein 5 [Zymoseptoria brevis]|uniref:Molybdate-anion transporter n=1 Tax=Zymoseptoria brevis TaxID=1047168 RepID=A0A0F4GTE6_9PEZI|nr:major facilitator superfamily transporter domain-containing protein 5 [Zymoseptoria brevis]